MKPNYDPARVARHGRREALFSFAVWFLAMLWTVGYCYLFGYRHGPDDWPVRLGLVSADASTQLRPVFGLPDWVVYGILLPWIFWSVVTVLFAQFGIADDDLGAEGVTEGPGHGH